MTKSNKPQNYRQMQRILNTEETVASIMEFPSSNSPKNSAFYNNVVGYVGIGTYTITINACIFGYEE